MQLVKQQLNQYLTDGDILSLMKAEKTINFDVIFSAKSKPFCNVTDERKLLDNVMKLTQRFITVNFPEVNAVDVSLQFAVDIIEIRQDWNLLDILNFFKFIRQRQDLPENKIFGNKISPIKLIELTSVYEENKSIAREIWHKNEISKEVYGTKEERLMIGASGHKLLGNTDTFKDTRFADLAKQIADKEKIKSDKVYENAAVTRQFHKDNEFCQKWLKEQEATDAEKLAWFKIFFNRK